MGDQFEDAYERFHEKIQAAHKHLNVNKLKNAQKSLNDCAKQIKNMEREARHSDGVERRRLLEKIKKSKTMLQKTKQEYQQIAAGGGSPSRNTRNNELYGNPAKRNSNQSFNAMSDSNKTRARILENSSTQKETDDLLLDSRRIANETREIGTAALNSIEDQTDMLIEAKDSVNQTHLETKRAGQLLNTMSRRVFTNKLFLGFVILLLIGINVLLIYLYHNKAAPSPSPPIVPPTPAMLPSVPLESLVKPLATATSSSATTTTAAKGGSLLAPQHHAAPLRVTFSPPLLAKKKMKPVVLSTNAATENTKVEKNTVSTPLGSALALKEMAAKDEAAEMDQHLGRLGNLGRFKAVQTTLITEEDSVQKNGRLRKV